MKPMRLTSSGLAAASIAIFGLAALFCSTAGAQTKTPIRVGILSGAVPRSAPFYQAFDRALTELGYVEGRNLVVEFRNADGQAERLPGLAAELVRLKLDVLIAPGSEPTLRAAKQATGTTPIVVVAIDYDPIALGYIAGLARPGGNVTGLFLRQLELTTKRIELLKDAIPKIGRIAALWDTFSADQLKEAEGAARAFDVQVQALRVQNPQPDFEDAFRLARKGRADAMLVLMSPIFFRDRKHIIDLANKNRLATISGGSDFAEAGALITYGANLIDMFRRAAMYVDKILKGAKP
ncbi:MAG TPA: ABC transporter substrate-binding protein, partial [Candidatus Binatia bacterium]